MGKIVISFAFIFISLLSAWVFFNREERSLREQINSSERPRIILEDFVVYRYEKSRVSSTLSGRIGHFIEPNIMEIYGDIRGTRYNKGEREYLRAESSSTIFQARGIVDLMKSAQIVKSELENDVQFGFNGMILNTQFAEFLNSSQIIRSDVPVFVSSVQGKMTGKRGFNYNITEELIDLYGPIQGYLQNGPNFNELR